MNFSEMKRDIYESWKDGEITKDTAARLLISFESACIDHELDLAMEAVDNAESSFMESAMHYSSGESTQEVFEAEAKSFGDAVKKAWEAFKKWVKNIVEKIGKKLSEIKAKITGDKGNKVYSKMPIDKIKSFTDKVISHLKPPYSDMEKAVFWSSISVGSGLFVMKQTGVLKEFKSEISEGIHKNLIKIQDKLIEIEAKYPSNVVIKCLRPVISLCNSAIASIIIKNETKNAKDIANRENSADIAHDLRGNKPKERTESELMNSDDEFKVLAQNCYDQVKAYEAEHEKIISAMHDVDEKINQLNSKYFNKYNVKSVKDLPKDAADSYLKEKDSMDNEGVQLAIRLLKLNNENKEKLAVLNGKANKRLEELKRNENADYEKAYRAWSKAYYDAAIELVNNYNQLIVLHVSFITKTMGDKTKSDVEKNAIIKTNMIRINTIMETIRGYAEDRSDISYDDDGFVRQLKSDITKQNTRIENIKKVIIARGYSVN